MYEENEKQLLLNNDKSRLKKEMEEGFSTERGTGVFWPRLPSRDGMESWDSQSERQFRLLETDLLGVKSPALAPALQLIDCVTLEIHSAPVGYLQS